MNVLMQFASDFICLDSCSARRTPVPTRENVSTTALTGNKLTLPESTFELRLRRGRKRERQRERERELVTGDDENPVSRVATRNELVHGEKERCLPRGRKSSPFVFDLRVSGKRSRGW